MGKFRKAVSVVLLVLILITVCTSCKSGGSFLNRTPDMNTQYKAEMKVQSGELEFACKVRRYGTEFWEMNVDAPETLAGLEITMNGENIKAVLDDLVLDVPLENVRNTAVFAMIFKALDNAAVSTLSCMETGEGMYYEGEFGGIIYRLTFDSESLKPLLLEIPEAGLAAKIKGFETIDEMEEMEALTQTSAETD